MQVPCPGITVKLFLFEKTHQERDEKWYILYMIPEEKYEVLIVHLKGQVMICTFILNLKPTKRHLILVSTHDMVKKTFIFGFLKLFGT